VLGLIAIALIFSQELTTEKIDPDSLWMPSFGP
jgi:hypothetical protein